jgi:hypothetical protein
MSNNPKSDKLFELVNSMSMSEKRYFKIFAGRHSSGEKSNYEKLFEVLEKMDVYDPESLQAGLKKQEVSTRYLSSDKNYLYNLILRSLSAFHWGKTPSLQVKEMLHQINILYERGMPEHCLRLLKKARNLAESQQLYSLLPEIEHYEYRSASLKSDYQTVETSLKNAQLTEENLQARRDYSELHHQVLEYRRQYAKARSQVVINRLEALLSHPLLSLEQEPKGFWAQLYYWEIFAAYHYIMGNRAEELQANEKLLRLIEAQPKYELELPAEYANVRSRILSLESHLDDEAFEARLWEFRKLPDRPSQAHHQINANIYVNSYLAEMWRLVEMKRFQEALDLLPAMESMYETFENLIPPHIKISYQYLYAYVYLANGELAESLRHINLVFNEFSDHDRPDLHAYLRLLSLLVHWEMGHIDLLPYQIDTTRRYLRKRGLLFESEKCMLRMMRKLQSAQDTGKQEKYLRKYLKELDKIFENPLEQKALIFFDLPTYLQARIAKQAMAAYCRANKVAA